MGAPAEARGQVTRPRTTSTRNRDDVARIRALESAVRVVLPSRVMASSKCPSGLWAVVAFAFAATRCGATSETGLPDASTNDAAAVTCTESAQCVDNDPCTIDDCNTTTHLCEHPPDTLCRVTLTRGTYDVSPTVSYSCAPLTIDPVSELMLTVGTGNMQVIGFPAVLVGAAPRDGTFQVGASFTRARTFRLTLDGTVQPQSNFDATLTVACTNCIPSDDCPTRTLSFRATRR